MMDLSFGCCAGADADAARSGMGGGPAAGMGVRWDSGLLGGRSGGWVTGWAWHGGGSGAGRRGGAGEGAGPTALKAESFGYLLIICFHLLNKDSTEVGRKFGQMNWCKFIVDQIRYSANKWKEPGGRKRAVRGCPAFLVVSIFCSSNVFSAVVKNMCIHRVYL